MKAPVQLLETDRATPSNDLVTAQVENNNGHATTQVQTLGTTPARSNPTT